MSYLVLKYLHVVGAMVIMGTGTGIAFFMLMAHRSGEAGFIAKTASLVVIADMVFTATAVIAQPISGYFLAREVGYDIGSFWIKMSFGLYLIAGAFWVPVVFMQKRMRDLARAAAESGLPLPDAYHRVFRWWFVFGFPGFGAVALIVWLMIARPAGLSG